MTRPHILLITTDQQRYDALGINGNQVLQTPNLDCLAANGVNFERCYSTCPVCIPARRTLISGQHPFTHGLRKYTDGLEWNPPFTLPGILGDAGYETRLIGKLHLHPQGKRYGYDHMLLSETSHSRPTSETQHRNDYVRWLKQNGIDEHPHFHGINGNGRLVSNWPLEDRFHHNNWLAKEATRYLCDDRDPSAPFFLHLSFFHPHPPLVPLKEYHDRYDPGSMEPSSMGEWVPDLPSRPGIAPDSALGPFDAEVIQRARAGYYALINHIDDCVAHVLERWQEYGNPRAKEPLYILYSSDHGEMLGDHHLFRKSLCYEGSSHIPFFIGGSNVDIQSGPSRELCCWEDVLPTIADLAGVDLPGSVDGRSLAPILRGEVDEESRDHLTGMCHGQVDNYFQVRGPHKYIWFPKTNEEQLFNLEEDPEELHDLSGNEDLLTPFRESIADELQEADNVHSQGGVSYDPAQLVPCNNQPPRAVYGNR
ncbi:MAG: sulfatase-like hydrolase/transferase [Kiritimatiellae bacterium]|jgi:arylsulfatase|nr:sulfatase-like hydrolase/transferase [Kiritimatiellia bacterium]